MPGVSASSRDRMLVVSGHYDSRNSDVLDPLSAAAGANDDASGVAAVMELTCVSRLWLPTTSLVARMTEAFENFNHQHQNVRTENGVTFGDLPEFFDPSYIADVAHINAAGLATLALAPAPCAG